MELRSDTISSANGQLESLLRFETEHPFWGNRFFQACRRGALNRSQLRYVFEQYHAYSRNFTRFLAALMANLDDDLARARLTTNLWDESGGKDPHDRHAEIFRRFLDAGLGSSLEIDYGLPTRRFVRGYLDYCMQADPCASAAFLSIGTEGIVPRMYAIMVDGLVAAGIAEQHLEFFHIHMVCDDDHALTLRDIMMSFAGRPDWYAQCLAGVDTALRLRHAFFEGVMDELAIVELASDDAGRSLDATSLVVVPGGRLEHGSTFTSPDLATAVHVIRVPAGGRHRESQGECESILYVMDGAGAVELEDGPRTSAAIIAGDAVFVPRSIGHRLINRGDADLRVLVVNNRATPAVRHASPHTGYASAPQPSS